MTSHRSRRWVIWIQQSRTTALHLLIYKPRHTRFLNWFSRWESARLVHYDGPVMVRSPKDEHFWVNEMIETGKTHIPEGQPYEVVFSLSEFQDFIDENWRP